MTTGKHHQNYWDTPGKWKAKGLSQQWKWFEIDLGEGMWLMKSILTSCFEKNLRITPGKLEESGKILAKDVWVRAHWRDKHRWKRGCWRDRWCTGTIEIFEWGDNLELIGTQANLLRSLEHSGRINKGNLEGGSYKFLEEKTPLERIVE